MLCWKSAMKPHWRWWVRKLPLRKSLRTTFFVGHAYWDLRSRTVHATPYIPHHTCLAVLNCGDRGISPGSNCKRWGQGGIWWNGAIQKVTAETSEKQTEEVARTPRSSKETLVAWPWEKAKRERESLSCGSKEAWKCEKRKHCLLLWLPLCPE